MQREGFPCNSTNLKVEQAIFDIGLVCEEFRAQLRGHAARGFPTQQHEPEGGTGNIRHWLSLRGISRTATRTCSGPSAFGPSRRVVAVATSSLTRAVSSRTGPPVKVHSSGDWLAPQAGISGIFKDLRHANVEIISKHGLHNKASAAWAARSRSPFIQDRDDDVWAATKSFLQSAGVHQICPFTLTSPFVWGFLRNLLQLMQDPDIGLIDIAESSCHTVVFEPIRSLQFICLVTKSVTTVREHLKCNSELPRNQNGRAVPIPTSANLPYERDGWECDSCETNSTSRH